MLNFQGAVSSWKRHRSRSTARAMSTSERALQSSSQSRARNTSVAIGVFAKSFFLLTDFLTNVSQEK